MEPVRRVTLKITNSLPVARILMLEPWAGEYRLSPGKTLEVIAEGDFAFPLEFEVRDDRVVLHGFDTTDSMLTVYDQGVQLRSNPPNIES